jgi:hypothetical protein
MKYYLACNRLIAHIGTTTISMLLNTCSVACSFAVTYQVNVVDDAPQASACSCLMDACAVLTD